MYARVGASSSALAYEWLLWALARSSDLPREIVDAVIVACSSAYSLNEDGQLLRCSIPWRSGALLEGLKSRIVALAGPDETEVRSRLDESETAGGLPATWPLAVVIDFLIESTFGLEFMFDPAEVQPEARRVGAVGWMNIRLRPHCRVGPDGVTPKRPLQVPWIAAPIGPRRSRRRGASDDD